MFYTLKHHIVKKGQTLHFISKTAVLESTFGHIYIYIYIYIYNFKQLTNKVDHSCKFNYNLILHKFYKNKLGFINWIQMYNKLKINV